MPSCHCLQMPNRRVQVPEAAIAQLRERIRGEVRAAEPMSKHTSYAIGGLADIYAIPQNVNDLAEVSAFARQNQMSLSVIGGGCNLLVSDAGYRGIVVDVTRGFRKILIDNDRVFVEAGVKISTFVKTCEDHRLSGVEQLAGIPGTVGGAVAMNAGAFGLETADHLRSVSILNPGGEVSRLKREDLKMQYRTSNLPPHSIVLDATFRLLKQPTADAIHSLGRAAVRMRKEKQPLEFRSLGSMFKNPPSGPTAGKLIDEANLKGTCRGGAQISEKHGNFIINKGSATAEDVRELLSIARNRVKAKYGVDLEPEVKLLGFDNGNTA